MSAFCVFGGFANFFTPSDRLHPRFLFACLAVAGTDAISMLKHFLIVGLFAACTLGRTLADVLIVADEMPVIQSLAARLNSDEHVSSQVVAQDELPASLASFDAVIV